MKGWEGGAFIESAHRKPVGGGVSHGGSWRQGLLPTLKALRGKELGMFWEGSVMGFKSEARSGRFGI